MTRELSAEFFRFEDLLVLGKLIIAAKSSGTGWPAVNYFEMSHLDLSQTIMVI